MEEAKYIGINGKAYDFVGSSIRGIARHSPLSANAVTVLSMLVWLVACGLILEGWWITAMVLGILASFGDAFDGAIARAQGQQGPKGAFLDFYADRLCDIAMFGVLAYAFSADRWIFIGALANLGITQLSSMFRNGLKMPTELVEASKIAALSKAFPALNLRRGIVGVGVAGLVLGYPMALSIALWTVAAWCLVVFTMLYVKVGLADVPTEPAE